MSTTDSDKNQWTDPKDYGLPFVKITPLRAKSIPVASIESIPIIETEGQTDTQTPISEIKEKPELVSTESPIAVTINRETLKSVSLSKGERKKTGMWVWTVLILGLVVVSFIIWQIQSQSIPNTNVKQLEIVEETSVVMPETMSSNEPESTTTEESQSIINQDSIQDINNSNPNISKPAETGTTIANIATGNLIRIESKTQRPQYFIIVGSLPNEKLAIEEASQYFGRSSEMYLISPEEGSRNYRLGLSKFGSFKLAAEELEQIKSQYTEELWILKY